MLDVLKVSQHRFGQFLRPGNPLFVKGILVNIFGGIAKCDVIAEGVVAAAKDVGLKVPLVVRLEGTNVERARELLEAARIDVLVPAADLTDAARKVSRRVERSSWGLASSWMSRARAAGSWASTCWTT